MRFNEALELLLIGQAVLRSCWTENECIFHESGNLDMTKHTREEVRGIPTGFFNMGDEYTTTRMPEIRKCNSDGSNQIWAPTNQDILAMDWITVDKY